MKKKTIPELQRMLNYTMMRLKMIKKSPCSKEYWKWRNERNKIKKLLQNK